MKTKPLRGNIHATGASFSPPKPDVFHSSHSSQPMYIDSGGAWTGHLDLTFDKKGSEFLQSWLQSGKTLEGYLETYIAERMLVMATTGVPA